MATQKDRVISVTTPLEADVLLFRRLHGVEQISGLFQFDLELMSAKDDIDPDHLLGKSLTVEFELQNDGTRYLNGYTTKFGRAGRTGNFTRYNATVRPWLWFLTRSADCRVFQEKSVPEIIKEIFKDRGFSGNLKDALTGNYRTLDFCVQYRETEFNFVSRLMEQEGISYYFTHEKTKHILVLADAKDSHQTVSDYAKVSYFPPDDVPREKDHFSARLRWSEIHTGAYVLDEFNFEKPKASLEAKSQVERMFPQSAAEIRDYPGEYRETAEGNHYVAVRMHELACLHEQLQLSGNVRGLGAGHLFTLVDERKHSEEEGLIVSSIYDAQSNAYESGSTETTSFSCSVNTIPSKTTFRPARVTPKPIIQGPQTAMVVGKQGEEIWTDKYGRIKLQFHWDRLGKHDEKSSCWVRVSHPWAGKGFGVVQIPRMGEEVIVEFLEGDPDRPIVTGRVYNATTTVPYALPDNQTKSGILTRSSKGASAANFNELRFEDKVNSEEIYFHAEKDFNRVVENNDTLKVGLEKKNKGNQTIEIHNDRKVTLREGNETFDIKKGNRTLTLDNGNETITLKMGDRTIKLTAGTNKLEAGKMIELKCGASSIKIEPAKITIKSPQVVIKADAQFKVEGAMGEVAGSGMLTLKGGLVKIN